MKTDRRGVIVIDDILLVAVIGLIVWLAGPPTVKAFGTLFNGGDKNQQKIVHKVDSVRTLYQLNPVTNKMEPVKETYSEYTNQLASQEPPETLWQKFWHLGFMAVVIIVVLSYLGILPIIRLWWNKKVKPKIDQAQAGLEAVQVQHDELHSQAIDIVQALDDGWDAYDAQVTAYNGLYTNETDPVKKAGYLATLSALQTARKAMKDKIYAELDNASLAKLIELQTLQA